MDEKLLNLEKEQLAYQKANLSLFRELTEGQALIKRMAGDILLHQTKHALMMYLMVFLAGIVIGTQYKSWTPYISDIIETAREAKHVNGVLKHGN